MSIIVRIFSCFSWTKQVACHTVFCSIRIYPEIRCCFHSQFVGLFTFHQLLHWIDVRTMDTWSVSVRLLQNLCNFWWLLKRASCFLGGSWRKLRLKAVVHGETHYRFIVRWNLNKKIYCTCMLYVSEWNPQKSYIL